MIYRTKIEVVLESYAKLEKYYKHLPSDRSKIDEKNSSFLETNNKLFDIADKDLETILRSKSNPRTTQTKGEDLDFLVDQRGERKRFMGGEDKKYQKAVQSKKRRLEKEQERKDKATASHSNLDLNVEDFEEDMVEKESKDEEYFPKESKARHVTKKQGKIILEIDLDELIENTSILCGRYNVSPAIQTAILAVVLKTGGQDIDLCKFSNSKVVKIRNDVIEKKAAYIRQGIAEEIEGKRLIIHIDTKKFDVVDEDFVTRDQERLAVVVTSPDFEKSSKKSKENESNMIETQKDILLGITECESGKGKDMADE